MPGSPSSDAARLRPGRVRWLLATPMVLAVLAYARVLDGEFQFDDASLEKGHAIKDLGVALRGFGDALVHGGRPVTDLTFALDYAVAGLEPWSFHVTNLAIHLAAVGLAFLFTRRVLQLAGAPGAALAAVVAGLFALHPLQSEAVSYVVQRAEALASAFYLAALLLLLEAERRGPGRRGALAWAAGLLAFALGLGAKTIVATLPATYLLLVGMVPGRDGRRALASWPRRLLMLAPFAALGAAFAFATLRGIEGRTDAGFAVPGLPPERYFLTQWRVLVTYLRLLLWPAGQNVDWAFPASRTLAEPAVLAAGLLLAALLGGAAACFRWARRREDGDGAAGRVAAFGVAWFFVVLSPTSSVVPLADPLAEHRVYLASWGLFAAAAVVASRVLSRLPAARRGLATAVLVGAAWGALTLALVRRNAAWETRLALWSDAVSRAPHNHRAWVNLGQAYQARGDYEAAVGAYRAALLRVAHAAPGGETDNLLRLADALVLAGRPDESLGPLRRALDRDPRNGEVLAGLAFALMKRGDLAAAEQYAARAVAVQPDRGEALEVLGVARIARGDAAGALQLFDRAASLDPDDGVRQYDLGLLYAMLGRTQEACAALRRATRGHVAPAVREKAAREAAGSGCPAR